MSIWTSSLTLAEVYKFKCDGPKALAIDQDKIFEAYVSSDFVVEVQVDHATASLSRRLCRQHPPLKKPNDDIHLATAVMSNVTSSTRLTQTICWHSPDKSIGWMGRC